MRDKLRIKYLTDKRLDFLEVLDYEREHRAKHSTDDGGNEAYPPIMAKLLFSIANGLRAVGFLLFVLCLLKLASFFV